MLMVYILGVVQVLSENSLVVCCAHMLGKEGMTGTHNYGGAGGQHSLAIHHENPHFQRAPMEAVIDICEVRLVDVCMVYAGEVVYAVLLPVEALRVEVEVGGLKFEVATLNRKDEARLKDILHSSSCHYRRVAQCLRSPDCRQPIPEISEILGYHPLLRRSICRIV